MVFVEMFWKSWNYSVGEPFMAPGGEMYRLYERFGENVLRHGSHEWLPYSKNAMRTKSPNTNLPLPWVLSIHLVQRFDRVKALGAVGDGADGFAGDAVFGIVSE